MAANDLSFQAIGIVHSCFKERFAIPRQAGLVPSATGTLEIFPEFSVREAFRELDDFSHIWLIWAFHQQARRGKWRATVRPPRMGGRQRRGVFATRSPFRPNPIGLSVVKLDGIQQQGRSIILSLSGIDMLEGTPVLDIKPYIPYSDALSHAKANFAGQAPQRVDVVLSNEISDKISKFEARGYPGLRALIDDVLALNPRSSRDLEKETFAVRLYDLDVCWHSLKNGKIVVTDVIKTGPIRREKSAINGTTS